MKDELDTADAIRPADAPERAADRSFVPQRPRRRAVAILFLLLAIGLVMVPVMLANDGRNLHAVAGYFGFDFHRPPKSSVSPDVKTADAASPIAVTPPPLALPVPAVVDPPTRLSPARTSWQPQPACMAIEPGATGEKPVFLSMQDGQWECTVLLVLSKTEHSGSIFLQARGQGAGDEAELSSLRLKLNGAGVDEAGPLAAKAVALIRLLPVTLSDDELAYLDTRMTELQPFRTDIGGFRFIFRQELNGASRFNLIANAVKPVASSVATDGQAR